MSNIKSPKLDSKAWRPWIALVQESYDIDTEDVVISLVWDTPKPYKRVVAAALAVAKWHPNRGRARGLGVCGWCEFRNQLYADCDVCPLYERDTRCLNTASLFMNRRKKEARDKLYRILYEIYVDEYRKVFK